MATSPFTATQGKTTMVPPSSLNTFHKNPRRGDIPAIMASLRRHSQYKPITGNVGTHTGRPREILAGNHTLMAFRELAEAEPDDPRWRKIAVFWVDVDDDMADRIVVADNQTGRLGGFDNDQLLELIDGFGDDITGLGFTEHDIDLLRNLDLNPGGDGDKENTDPFGDYADGAKRDAKKRTMPLDLIFTGAPSDVLGLLAYRLGWEPGCISTSASSIRRYQQTPNPKRIAFIDNEWHGYEHAPHVAAIAEFGPKYATVRDLLTPEQAEEAGVEYYDIPATLAMAEDIAPNTENVILIPKYDCMADLPREIGGRRVVLGYSVRSSYGGTPVSAKAFAGWPTHLLGGTWKDQRALLNVLGDDVVSLDNNLILKGGTFGTYYKGDGTSGNIQDVLGYPSFTMAVATSLANIARYISHEYGVELDIDSETDAIMDREETPEHV
ncbi:ParB-like nuclease domain protein [Mycobacterium phage Knocker]|nr:ParB-like nuclease domain protein [Mycobacterium phage Knocker]